MVSCAKNRYVLGRYLSSDGFNKAKLLKYKLVGTYIKFLNYLCHSNYSHKRTI